MSLSCGQCKAPTLTHLGQYDRQNDDSLIATADRYLFCAVAQLAHTTSPPTGP
jgi:hypothetical protein